MFADRFDALMSIAEVSNSQLGRAVNMNPSHIGRLRSGARPLPKKHEYLTAMCGYMAGRIKKDYQLDALQKLTGINSTVLDSAESTTLYLEQWLSGEEQDTSEVTGRLISGFSRLASAQFSSSADTAAIKPPQEYAEYLYGDAGKRKAVEQFFMMILQEEKPQTLLLFSDENMAWLYDDSVFAARWLELFTKAIQKGNRVRIIHTVSRGMNEMLEAVTKWIPIYMTGMIEPYFYPRLRDGIFQRTLFIAPKTAAVVSSSIQQNTDGMLNLFLTNRTTLDALTMEYERYFSLCRPLMRIFTEQKANEFHGTAENLYTAEGDAYLCCAMPPLFAMSKKLVYTLSEQDGGNSLISRWEQDFSLFKKTIRKQRLSVVILNPKRALASPNALRPYTGLLHSDYDFSYSAEQYALHIEELRQLETRYENLEVHFIGEFVDNTLLYAKEETGIIMATANTPKTAFMINDQNIVNAFWDFIERRLLV